MEASLLLCVFVLGFRLEPEPVFMFFCLAAIRNGLTINQPSTAECKFTDRGLFMAVHGPAEVTVGSFEDRIGYHGEVGGNMMLETVLANVAEQLLHVGDF